MRKIQLFLFMCMCSIGLTAQDTGTRNLIIVTLDGLRWQEVFGGADSAILFNPEYTRNADAYTYWNSAAAVRREKLMPFFWKEIAANGQLYGNREFGNQVNCANLRWFSYPGYSEILTGFVERRVRSNDPVENPNATVLEFIHNQPGFKNKVAAFGTWDVFPYIFREERSGIPVNAGMEMAEPGRSEREDLLNELQSLLPNPHGSRYDAFTFYYAFEYLKRERPRVLFIGFDETDQHAHGGRYDDYLLSASRTDLIISRLWTWIQSQEDYKDQTTLLITTDHGRGKNPDKGWKKHGLLFGGSGQAWFAVIGPDTPASGEMKTRGKYFLKQLACTVTSFLGLDYDVKEAGECISTAISLPVYSDGELK